MKSSEQEKAASQHQLMSIAPSLAALTAATRHARRPHPDSLHADAGFLTSL